jgi:hypothetical protein
MSVEKGWALFLELTNEATVAAESIGDYALAELACAAAMAAADRLGLSQDRIIALRQDLRRRAGAAPPGTRLSPPLLICEAEDDPAPRKAGAGRSRSRAAR